MKRWTFRKRPRLKISHLVGKTPFRTVYRIRFFVMKLPKIQFLSKQFHNRSSHNPQMLLKLHKNLNQIHCELLLRVVNIEHTQ